MGDKSAKSAGLKLRLSAGDVLFGPVINMLEPLLIETVCAAGADFVFLDFEHGLKDLSAIARGIMAAEVWGVPALVRIGERSANLVARVLDGGAAGIIFPHVSSSTEAAELVSWCRYKPRGQRGSGMTRGSLRHSGSEYERRQRASEDVVCLMVIEDRSAADQLEEILVVDGVTGVAIGPGDLSMELGVDSWDHPLVTQLLDAMAGIVRRHKGSALLRLARTAGEVSRAVESGANMLLLNHDVHLIRGMYETLFAQFRQALPGSRWPVVGN